MNFYNVDTVNIPFDKKWKNIAISVSGGADSALLAYLICSFIADNTTIHIINHVRMWKTRPWQQYDADRVIQWLAIKFPNITFQRHTNFIAPDLEWGNKGRILTDEYGKEVSGDNIQQRAYAEFICHHHNIDAYYNAVTRNPKNVEFKGLSPRDVDPTEDNQHLVLMKHMDCWAVHPFRFTEKSWVVKQYRDMDLTDLFEITRSCEGEFADIDYKSYTPGQYVPLCNECFWCKERQWAIDV
jgi:hypothetical protein